MPDPNDPRSAQVQITYRGVDRQTAVVQHNETDYDFLAMQNRAQTVAISLLDVRVRSIAPDPAGGSTQHVTWTYQNGGVTHTDSWDKDY